MEIFLMEWLTATSVDLENFCRQQGNVCIVPFGCLERHSDHLPLGSDSLLAYKLACLAAEQEAVVVFPPQHYMMVASAAAHPGAIVFNAKLSMQICETVFDEIARNGFKKIILYNFHGGNRNILPLLLQNQLPRQRTDYALYLPKFDWIIEDVFKTYCQSSFGGHADEWETSLHLHLFPELVKMDRVPAQDVGHPQNRLSHLAGIQVQTSVDFFADYPTHYAGEAEYATAEKGRVAAEAIVKRLAHVIQVVKQDSKTLDMMCEFFDMKTQLGKI
jgi:creatinine amidohydrolase